MIKLSSSILNSLYYIHLCVGCSQKEAFFVWKKEFASNSIFILLIAAYLLFMIIISLNTDEDHLWYCLLYNYEEPGARKRRQLYVCPCYSEQPQNRRPAVNLAIWKVVSLLIVVPQSQWSKRIVELSLRLNEDGRCRDRITFIEPTLTETENEQSDHPTGVTVCTSFERWTCQKELGGLGKLETLQESRRYVYVRHREGSPEPWLTPQKRFTTLFMRYLTHMIGLGADTDVFKVCWIILTLQTFDTL